MKKETLFNEVMDAVSRCTGIARDDIIRCKSEECTDARSVAVHMLSRYLTDTQIASLMGITARGVSYIRNSFLPRSSKWFVRSNYEEVAKLIGTNH